MDALLTDQPAALKAAAAENFSAYIREHGHVPARLENIGQVIGYVDTLLRAVGDALKARDKRIAALETRLADFQQHLSLSARVKALEKGGTTASANTDTMTLDALAKRIEALERRPSLEYKGVWREGTSYGSGSCVTWGGSAWIANQPTSAKPGEGATGWQLAVKAGRDGRDFR